MNIRNQLWPFRLFIEQYGKESVSKQCLDFVRTNFNKSIDTHANTARYLKQSRRLSFQQLNQPYRYQHLELFTSYYRELNPERNKEILFSINKNLQNRHIKKVHLFVEHKNDFELNYLYSILSKNLDNIDKLKVVACPFRPTFSSFASYIKQLNRKNTLFCISNSDCFFIHNLIKAKLIDFNQGLFCCLTRKDFINGHAALARDPELGNHAEKNPKLGVNHKPLPFFSSDAWIFCEKSLDCLENIETEIGTLNCEQILTGKMHESGFKIRNVGFGGHVDCIHYHESNFRPSYSQEFVDSQYDCKYVFPFLDDPKNINEITPYNYIHNSKSKWCEQNYFFDERFSGQIGNYFVRDLRNIL
jgi:hypothetical protein